MPVVALPTAKLCELIGSELDDDALDRLLDRLGCDVEGFTTVRRFLCPACKTIVERAEKEDLLGACPECLTDAGEYRAAFWEEIGTERVIRMELLPVRPDLFDAGGLARAIRGLLHIEAGLATYELGDSLLEVRVDPAMARKKSYRPCIECAVVRNVKLDDSSIRLVMNMQEDLHWALGRDRKFASVGVYDLSRVKGPFHYRPVGPKELRFVPLATTDGRALTPQEILSEHPKGIDYKHLLEGHEAFPLLIDDAGQVLSMPPIINSHETVLRPETTALFIDVTGIEPRPVTKTLNVITTSLAELFPGSRIETVQIKHPDHDRITPDLDAAAFSLSVSEVVRVIGVPLDANRICELLGSMRHGSEKRNEGITVAVPAYRSDILHEVDLIEDVAFAIGYAEIPRVLIPSFTLASERTERRLASRVRTTLLGLGFTEAMSLMLTNAKDLYKNIRSEDPGDAVCVENPASQDQTILRTSLASGLLRLLTENRGAGLSHRIFEADDVVRIEKGEEEPVEKLHVAAAIQDRSAGFADVKSVVDAIGRELGKGFLFRPVESGLFLEGRGAELLEGGRRVGFAGEVHPEVLENFSLAVPVAVLEIELN